MLIGRDAELAEIEARTKTHRLITVVGPGGVGKTTLARAAAGRLAERYQLGALELDLSRVDDPQAVAGAMAAQLGYDSFDALLASPTDRPALVVVDNCEHLIDAAAAVVAQLLGACQQPTVIASSRSPLELPGESVIALAPLRVPAIGDDPANSPSVQLFLQRARDAGSHLDLTEPTDREQLDAVADLCRRLDGLPLALEIAAARTRTMSVAEIAARLHDTIDVLDRPRFRGDPRHRSIADAIRWSYELLTPRQAALLDRLAVFNGPFTALSGRAFAGGDTFDADLDELVNDSLVAVDDRTDVTQYLLLATVRRFALDQLRRRGELDRTYDEFVDFVVATAQRIVAGASVSWRPGLVHDLVAAYDDIAEALGHAIAHDPGPERAYRLCGVLWGIVHQAHADDIADLCRRTLERWPADGSALGAQTVAALATAEYVTGHPQRAIDLAVPVLASLDQPSLATITLHRVLGQSQRATGDLTGAVETFRAGSHVGHTLGLTSMALELDVAAATVTADIGDIAGAINELNAVIKKARELDSVITECWALAVLGWISLRHDVTDGRAITERMLSHARQVDYPIAIAVGLRSRVYADLLDGDIAGAVATTQELLDELTARGALSNLRVLLDTLAVVAHRAGHPSWERFAVTCQATPITTLVAADYALIPLPPATGAPLARHEAVVMARTVLSELAGQRAMPPSIVSLATIRQLGDVVEFGFAGRTVAVRSSKGVSDVVRLIEAAGSELHALDLADAAVEQSSTGEAIDAVARREYEQRIRDLQGEIDEAEANSDYERAYRLQVELDSLIEHLAAALGHGNRARRGADTAERARSAVTHRVRGTIRQLGKLHPQLGRHLAHAINTGVYCSYRPEQPTTWQIT